jgi:ABC-2 type transport system permease protein
MEEHALRNITGAMAAIWQRELLRYVRDIPRIVSTLVQPLVFLAILGTGLASMMGGRLNLGGVSFLEYMYPGIIAISIMSVAFFCTISTVWDREFGFLREMMVAPLPRTAIALGKTLGSVTISVVEALLLLIIAPFVGVHLTLAIVLSLIGFMVLLALAVSGLGLFIASLLDTLESYGPIMQVLIFPMFFLSGAFFLLTTAPAWERGLARISPLTYAVDGFRRVMIGSQLPPAVARSILLYPAGVDALALFAFACVTVGAAVFAFSTRKS